jgi:hypothetical protein
MRASQSFRASLAAGLTALLTLLSVQSSASEAARKTFATPEEAANALLSAIKSNDEKELIAILGPSLKQWIESGDPVADKNAKEKFVTDYEQKQSIDTGEKGKAILIIGDDDFPFPIPLAKSGDKWAFDPEQGKQEIIDRRVGANELDTIQALLAIADAQDEYVELNPEKKKAAGYARRFISSLNKQDGLYWPSSGAQSESPLGALVADAVVAGYSPSSDGGEASKNPYHGYYFHMLMGQGPHAAGGAYRYLVKGQMIGGFAVIAWPAKYGVSGYKTFIINQDRAIYQTDLGPETAAKVRRIRAFDPDDDWKKVDVN